MTRGEVLNAILAHSLRLQIIFSSIYESHSNNICIYMVFFCVEKDLSEHRRYIVKPIHSCKNISEIFTQKYMYTTLESLLDI